MNGVDVDFYLDTGAAVTILTVQSFEQLDCKLFPSTTILLSADGSKMENLGELDVKISGKRGTVKDTAYVVKGANRDLLGRRVILELGLLVVVNAVCQKAFNPFTEFPKL